VIQETSAGGTCINAANIQFSHENLPFGGIGNSGLGNAHGFYGFRAFFSHERGPRGQIQRGADVVSSLYAARKTDDQMDGPVLYVMGTH
jgi:acyl-CoA reductase-like NAD-dependent aldehyde dehydrogenase